MGINENEKAEREREKSRRRREKSLWVGKLLARKRRRMSCKLFWIREWEWHNATYQVSYVGNLNGIVNDFGSCASISLIKHCFVNDNGSFNIFGCITDISFVSASAIRILMIHKARQVLLSSPTDAPLQTHGICAAFVLLCFRLEDYMRMFLIE